jgi:hypothetical protein
MENRKWDILFAVTVTVWLGIIVGIIYYLYF